MYGVRTQIRKWQWKYMSKELRGMKCVAGHRVNSNTGDVVPSVISNTVDAAVPNCNE